VLKEGKAALRSDPDPAQAGPAHKALLFIAAPRGAASGFLELKVRLLNFLWP
jgi:hypothetical protein